MWSRIKYVFFYKKNTLSSVCTYALNYEAIFSQQPGIAQKVRDKFIASVILNTYHCPSFYHLENVV